MFLASQPSRNEVAYIRCATYVTHAHPTAAGHPVAASGFCERDFAGRTYSDESPGHLFLAKNRRELGSQKSRYIFSFNH